MCFPSVLVSSVAITTYYRLVAQTALISHSLEAGNLRSVGLCSGEGPLPGLSMVAFLLCSHMSEKLFIPVYLLEFLTLHQSFQEFLTVQISLCQLEMWFHPLI